MLFYRASLPLSRSTMQYVTGVVRRHRKQTSSKGRALPPGMQALMTLVYLRKGETFAQLGAGFQMSTTTAWRYVDETVTLLSARSPKLSRALAKAKADGLPYLVLDGTLIPIDRVKADRPFYSGKHKKHGMNLQVIAAPDGTVRWVSGALPGSVHDLTAARIWGRSATLPPRGCSYWRTRPTSEPAPTSRSPARARTCPSPARTPTAHTPGCAGPANAPTPSSRAGRS